MKRNKEQRETINNVCPDCGGDIRIRNPTGKCDHLYYPDYKGVNMSLQESCEGFIQGSNCQDILLFVVLFGFCLGVLYFSGVIS